MEKYILDKDINTICVKASSFPEGVMEAHNTLHALLSNEPDRKYFGISRPEGNNGIIYKAAAEELHDGEAEKLNLETFVIKKGNYTSIFIPDFMKDIPAIGKAFQELLANPEIDHNGACIECYINDKDVRCMVRLRD